MHDESTADESLARAVAALWELPPAIDGNGGDRATYRAAALLMNDYGLDLEVAFALLEDWNESRCEPPWTEAELRRKLRSALANGARNYFADEDSQMHEVKPRGCRTDYSAILHIIDKHSGFEPTTIFPLGVESVKSESPSKAHFSAKDVLPLLFPGNPLVTTSYGVNAPETKPLNEIVADAHKRQFIVPNACIAREGLTLDGKLSQHCKSIMGPRQYLVLETDFKPEGECGKMLAEAELVHELSPLDVSAFILGHMTLPWGHLPAMVVYSGNKSAQAWYQMQGESPYHKEFMEYAIHFGADPATWSKCQFVRMPGGTRISKNGGPSVAQPIWYFDPKECIKP